MITLLNRASSYNYFLCNDCLKSWDETNLTILAEELDCPYCGTKDGEPQREYNEDRMER
jgi:DNA-directed RNA polymerase subunit RPC12/RpoP